MLIKSDSEAAKIQDLTFKMNYLQKQTNYLKTDKYLEAAIREEKLENLEKQITTIQTEIQSLEMIAAEVKNKKNEERITQPIYLNDASKKIIRDFEFNLDISI